tara:strand:- start:63689 stop:66010 length:2322 start_codon:yes stop_codon:yes gene_type:complete
MTQLVIVESPAKAKTINKYLGKDYKVLASYGHIRDLRPKSGAVEPDNGFLMHYETIDKNKKHLDEIARAMKTADSLLLAPDPDREGEAIAWHILEYLKTKRGLMKGKTVHRVVFHEITKTAIKAAIDNPRDISMDLVDAQQARRALDYLVGFNLSPLLWKKIRRGLSAGRVQSPALRLIVERELDIEKFDPKEYWSIEALLEKAKQKFNAKLIELKGVKLEQFDINNDKDANKARDVLLKQADGKLDVAKVSKKQRKRNPAPPFITSTLQQEASRKIGFTAQRTMRTAQQLYEGIDIGMGSVGLITYMRTDSVNMADEALVNIRELIASRYGKENMPDEPRVFKTKSKNAQEAHEAIRPTDSRRDPESIKDYLTPDQKKLYDLIWKRTVASQMIHATLDTVAVDLIAGNEKQGGKFRANGSTIKTPGFIAVYQEGKDDEKAGDGDEKMLPVLVEGEQIDLADIQCNQHFTEPPPRFSEASLVKALEEFGIGRPSTYASIISTLQQRDYVVLDKKRFTPTDVGRVVVKFLTTYFTQYVDYDFTANLEDQLDNVAEGTKKWVPVLDKFWKPFTKLIVKIDKDVQRSDVTQEKMDEKCPECEKPLSIRLGRNGRFIGCTDYPECKYTRNMDGDESPSEPEIVADRKCPKCESDLIIKHGPYGKFIGCSSYPKCKFIEPLEKPKPTGVKCPTCKKGDMVFRKSKRGKIFYSCSDYPDCKYAVWNEPLNETCPDCAWPMLTLKITKRRGKEKVCPQESCGFSVPAEDDGEDAAENTEE